LPPRLQSGLSGFSGKAEDDSLPLPFLFSIPGDDERALQQFMFWHEFDHFEINAALQSQRNVFVPSRILYPFNIEGVSEWLEQHQQTHNDINAALGVPTGADLSQLDLRDGRSIQAWVYQNAQEHSAMRAVLAI
jgi:hypothetical protein